MQVFITITDILMRESEEEERLQTRYLSASHVCCRTLFMMP